MADKNELGSAQIPIRATLDKLDGDLKKAEGKLEGGLGGIVNKLGGTFGKIGATLGKITLGAVVGVGAGIAALGGAAFAAGMTIDEAYDNIMTKTGATGERLEGLQESFGKVFGNFPADALAVSDAIAGLNQTLGLTGPELEGLATSILTLSKLTDTDASSNVEKYSRVMGDWSVSSEDASEVLDKLFKTSQLTGAGVDDLMTKMVQFGAPMRLMGFTIEDSMAMFGKWQKEGVNAELVMGSLRIAAGKFAKEGKPLRESLLATFESIQNTTDASAALSEGMEVFGLRAGPDMTAAIREGRFAFEDLIESLDDSTGSLANTLEATMDWPEKLEMLKNKATLILAPIGLAFMDIAASILDSAGPALEKFGAFIKEKVLPAMGPLLEGLQQLFATGTPEAWAKLGVPPGVIQTIKDISGLFADLGGIVKTALKGLFSGENVWEDTPALLDPSGNFIAATPGLKSQLNALGRKLMGWLGEGLAASISIFSDWGDDFLAWSEGDGATAAHEFGSNVAGNIIEKIKEIITGSDDTISTSLTEMFSNAILKMEIGANGLLSSAMGGFFEKLATEIGVNETFSTAIGKSLEELFLKAFTLLNPLTLGAKIREYLKKALGALGWMIDWIGTGSVGGPQDTSYNPRDLLNPEMVPGNRFAEGVTGIVRQPTNFLAGEVPELLSITPLSQLGSGSAGSGGISGGTFNFVFPDIRDPEAAAQAVHRTLITKGGRA